MDLYKPTAFSSASSFKFSASAKVLRYSGRIWDSIFRVSLLAFPDFCGGSPAPPIGFRKPAAIPPGCSQSAWLSPLFAFISDKVLLSEVKIIHLKALCKRFLGRFESVCGFFDI